MGKYRIAHPKEAFHASGCRALLALLCLLWLLGCSNFYSETNLYGTWYGTLGSAEMLVTFNEDRSCEISVTEPGSKPVKLTGNFEVDFSKRPIPLTIRNTPQLNHPLHTIIEFIGYDTIKMAEFAPRWRIRPISFSPKTQVILSRRK